jgi:rare lipoprotein A
MLKEILLALPVRRICTLFFIIFFLFLNGCAHVHTKDGPPNYYVDETKIPNAVPKVEPLSRIGNTPSYVVFGRRYYVLNSSKNYEERGIASWYGTKFHSHHTSNGERYDMLAMTAAHKSLPLPTYVEVTNLKNGKQIIVKVNDRGPFEANRIIDLSYVAAKKLGMLGHGTTYVDVKAIDPRDAYDHADLMAKSSPQHHGLIAIASKTTSATHYVHRRSSATSDSSLYLQVGSFHNRANAIRLQKHLMRVVSVPVKVDNRKNIFRVQVGPFKDVATAKHASERLKAAGVHSKQVVEVKQEINIT